MLGQTFYSMMNCDPLSLSIPILCCHFSRGILHKWPSTFDLGSVEISRSVSDHTSCIEPETKGGNMICNSRDVAIRLFFLMTFNAPSKYILNYYNVYISLQYSTKVRQLVLRAVWNRIRIRIHKISTEGFSLHLDCGVSHLWAKMSLNT